MQIIEIVGAEAQLSGTGQIQQKTASMNHIYSDFPNLLKLLCQEKFENTTVQ